MSELAQQLAPFGADVASFRAFDTDGPDLLPYATLVTARAAKHTDLVNVDGVYEWQDEPLMFLVSAGRLNGDVSQLSRIRRLLAMRGDAPYLGVVSPGRLNVYRISLDAAPPLQAQIDLGIPTTQRFTTFVYLGNTRPGIAENRRWISDIVLKLLTSTIDRLKALKVDDDDAISLVGRALFTRFLADRNLLPRSRFENPAKAFDSTSQARITSDWLDDTFNGDFLPLTSNAIQRLPSSAFKLLGDILHRAPEGQLQLGWEQRWNYLDFAHIPVGVLSQAYEHYVRKHAPRRQRQEGGFYTPRPITDLMVRTAFHAYGRDHRLDKARVLDAAAGAGVFLLTAFRELVAERWRHDRVRPNTQILRQVLYEQITGFDINESALRFAALGLYLISIELDPAPEPVQKLRFKNLRGKVLHKVGNGTGLGSLGDEITTEHVGRYDIVVGNPPWTTGAHPPHWSDVSGRVVRIAKERLGDESVEPALPNECLDLPFLWRAMEWTKPGGQIALALHARLLFQQGDRMPDARRAIFRALDITAIINGAELRGTKVWPNISAPFCLLFATNHVPPPSANFRFVSPHLESPLNSAGTMRIDASNAQTIASQELIDHPHLLKVLFRGTQADLQIYERLNSIGLPTFEDYWRGLFGSFRARPRCAGNGYQRLRESSARFRDGRRGVPSGDLANLPEFTPHAIEGLLININRLHPFPANQRLHRKRSRSIFRGPLLIVHKSPPAAKARIEAWVAEADMLFNETYYGYSAHEHPRGTQLVRYLALLLSSKVALWLALITSGEFGFEREVVEKTTIDHLFVPRFENLDSVDLAEIDRIFEAVSAGTATAWDEVDTYAARQYGLKDHETRVINDTLQFNLPFSANRREAQQPPDQNAVSKFCNVISADLLPWSTRHAREVNAVPDPAIAFSPWRGLRLYFTPTAKTPTERLANSATELPSILQIADQLSASEVMYPDSEGNTLWLGRLNQARYWSETQAHLVAQRVIWDHINLVIGRS